MLIRKYRLEDRAAVRKIAFDTALIGAPGTSLIDDREALSDILTGYFTDIEPESAFVAEVSGRVVGYVIGAKDSRVILSKFFAIFMPRLAGRLFTTSVIFRKNNFKSLVMYIKSAITGEFRLPDIHKEYPATLHINIEPDYRGHNVGSLLMDEYIEYLVANNAPGVHLVTMSEGAADFFRKHGFGLLHKRRRSCFRHILGRDVPVFVFGRKL